MGPLNQSDVCITLALSRRYWVLSICWVVSQALQHYCLSVICVQQTVSLWVSLENLCTMDGNKNKGPLFTWYIVLTKYNWQTTRRFFWKFPELTWCLFHPFPLTGNVICRPSCIGLPAMYDRIPTVYHVSDHRSAGNPWEMHILPGNAYSSWECAHLQHCIPHEVMMYVHL